MRLRLSGILFLCWFANAPAAMAPPKSLEAVMRESDVVATLKIETVKTAGDRAIATAVVVQALKGTQVGERLTIESSTTLAESARYDAGDECLVFLRRRGDHYVTPRGMFGKYAIEQHKVLQWIIGCRRPENSPLKAVIADIQRAGSN